MPQEPSRDRKNGDANQLKIQKPNFILRAAQRGGEDPIGPLEFWTILGSVKEDLERFLQSFGGY